MAKTNDPHAAAIKSWQTRARNAGGGGVVQQGDEEFVAELKRQGLYDDFEDAPDDEESE